MVVPLLTTVAPFMLSPPWMIVVPKLVVLAPGPSEKLELTVSKAPARLTTVVKPLVLGTGLNVAVPSLSNSELLPAARPGNTAVPRLNTRGEPLTEPGPKVTPAATQIVPPLALTLPV